MMRKKKGGVPFFVVSATIAVVCLVLAFLVIWPQFDSGGKILAELFGWNERCRETGVRLEDYQKDIPELMDKDKVSDAANKYIEFKKCFSEESIEFKDKEDYLKLAQHMGSAGNMDYVGELREQYES